MRAREGFALRTEEAVRELVEELHEVGADLLERGASAYPPESDVCDLRARSRAVAELPDATADIVEREVLARSRVEQDRDLVGDWRLATT